ncbi:MAG: helix-turn-helix domain-containing protein [Acidimicrobiales bacterium]
MTPSERRHEPVLPGFREMAERRRALVRELGQRRVSLGLTQTEVAARMGTSQSAVARLESGEADVRLSTIERYAAALNGEIAWELRGPGGTSTGPDQSSPR